MVMMAGDEILGERLGNVGRGELKSRRGGRGEMDGLPIECFMLHD